MNRTIAKRTQCSSAPQLEAGAPVSLEHQGVSDSKNDKMDIQIDRENTAHTPTNNRETQGKPQKSEYLLVGNPPKKNWKTQQYKKIQEDTKRCQYMKQRRKKCFEDPRIRFPSFPVVHLGDAGDIIDFSQQMKSGSEGSKVSTKRQTTSRLSLDRNHKTTISIESAYKKTKNYQKSLLKRQKMLKNLLKMRQESPAQILGTLAAIALDRERMCDLRWQYYNRSAS